MSTKQHPADQLERFMEIRDNRRQADANRTHDRLSRLESEAEALVGELCREGQTVHYINLRNGKTKEGSRFELVAFLVRNNYV